VSVGRGFLRRLRLRQHHPPAPVIFQGDDFRFSKAIACVLEVPAPDLGNHGEKSKVVWYKRVSCVNAQEGFMKVNSLRSWIGYHWARCSELPHLLQQLRLRLWQWQSLRHTLRSQQQATHHTSQSSQQHALVKQRALADKGLLLLSQQQDTR
jgi:hypothetical protein